MTDNTFSKNTSKRIGRGILLNNKKKYLKIFLSTLYLSAFTFGGGSVIITLLKQKFVDELHWIDNDEMLDLVAISLRELQAFLCRF